jgi:hypothetical protein
MIPARTLDSIELLDGQEPGGWAFASLGENI